MNKIIAPEGSYLTQIATNIPIEERGFFKELIGVAATYEYFRIATEEEIAEWEEYKKKQEENEPIKDIE